MNVIETKLSQRGITESRKTETVENLVYLMSETTVS